MIVKNFDGNQAKNHQHAEENTDLFNSVRYGIKFLTQKIGEQHHHKISREGDPS